MKKIIALLLVLVMALSIAACAPKNNTGSNTGNNSGTNQTPNTPNTPNTPETPAEPDPNADLVLDENDMGVCNVCGGDPVKWIPITASDYRVIGSNITESLGHRHFYLFEDVTTNKMRWVYAKAKDNNVCLHLNNKTLNVLGEIYVGFANAFNIMGNGTVNYTSEPHPDYAGVNCSMFYVETGEVTLYGGTYKSEAPIVATPNVGNPQIKITGTASVSSVKITLGSLTVDGEAKVDKVELGDSTNKDKQGEKGKLWVTKDFTGEIKSLVFPGAIANNKVPMDYAAAMGAFTGKVTTADGVALTGTAGALVTAAQ